jgi:hypothetical protein
MGHGATASAVASGLLDVSGTSGGAFSLSGSGMERGADAGNSPRSTPRESSTLNESLPQLGDVGLCSQLDNPCFDQEARRTHDEALRRVSTAVVRGSEKVTVKDSSHLPPPHDSPCPDWSPSRDVPVPQR